MDRALDLSQIQHAGFDQQHIGIVAHACLGSRDVEGVWEGVAKLVGTNEKLIFNGMKNFYKEKTKQLKPRNIYGDGHASEKIAAIVEQEIQKETISEIPTITIRDITTGQQ